MRGCNVILQAGVTASALNPSKPNYKTVGTVVIYNYFCMKLTCFQAFFGRDKGVMKNCPNCKMNNEVVGRFE
jgi:hypothetical protein